MKKLYFHLIALTLLICFGGCADENHINFENISDAEALLEKTAGLFEKTNSKTYAIGFDAKHIYFEKNIYLIDDTLRYIPFSNLKPDEYSAFRKNLKYLYNNNVIAIRGPLQTGFITFVLKPANKDKFGDFKYLAIDKGNLNLNHSGLKIIDKKSSIILLDEK